MKFLLTGVETNNKGAELMLYAILQEIENRHPNSKVYIERNRLLQGPSYLHTSIEVSLLDSFFERILRKSHLNAILKKIHIPIIHIYPKVPKIDYLLDASGLFFADKMVDSNSIKYWISIFRQVKNHNAKIIFLPQAFGPIQMKETRYAIDLMLKNAHLVYARENISFNYLKSFATFDLNIVKVSPDFTSLVKCACPMQYSHLKNSVCIIPNKQMVNKGVVSLEEYISYIECLILISKEYGKNVYILNHQGIEDETFINICKKRMKHNVEIISGLNALDTKGLISTAYLVITSRFHGLASSLNSCVPSLATSWNHKYQCLFEDYGQSNCILSIKDKNSDIQKIKEFLNPTNNANVRESLSYYAQKNISRTKQMWNDVWKS